MNRREWLRGMWRELAVVRGRGARARWLLGIVVFALRAYAPQLVALGVVAGVVGGTFGNHERFLEVERSGSSSWIGALLLTVPTAFVGLIAAVLVLRQHKQAVRAAYSFLALVIVCSVVSVGNVTPVRPFMEDWQHATSDPRAAHHADELRVNSAIGALFAAGALVFVARRRRGSRSAA